MGSTSPFTPFDANQSRFGFGVASRGVLWPSSVSGRSPRPSKITRRILRASISAAEGPVPRYVFAGHAGKGAARQRFREDICRRSACSKMSEARMSAMVACPRCGAPNSPGNLFCSNCGIVLTGSVQQAAIPAPYWPMWPPPPAPHSTSNLTAVLVVLVIVILVALAGVAAVFLRREGQIPPPSPAPAVGGFVARSAAGTNWTLTITSAPTALSPSAPQQSILTRLGASAPP